ncbi:MULTISPECIES: acyl-CoA dehydrogenase family protein [Streptacidiphilus]|uniref:Acyl-CoA dehydrogenase family protein n=1 Tax=Streptacidiphilus cavernicola TaxID=3342716 RepID=A0ABV6UUQ2_9ACTN|nr:acyl-CoA dehydrogenase family protein [Streptacidiphilus jeojiense]
MELMISDEQLALIGTVRAWLADRADLARARADRDGAGLVRREDVRAAAGLGLVGLLRSGEGGTHADLALVAEELGRAGSPLPIGRAAVVCRLLELAGIDGDAADRIASGELLAVPAVAEPGEDPVLAVLSDSGAVLTGTLGQVLGGSDADLLLVAAVTDRGEHVLALLDADGPGITRTRRTALDLTRDLARVDLDGAVAQPERSAVVDPAVHRLLVDALTVHQAADAVGAADLLLERTVQYVKERRQFGVAVGSFQAVKHHAANMALDVRCARLTVRAAARALDGGEAVERATRVANAGSLAKEACARVAGTALQLHGGMGFTWEHDLHLYLRRIKTSELLDGTPRHHRSALAAVLLPGGPARRAA